MKNFSNCYLHIGTEKTGTSSLQLFFARNRRKLAEQGFLYPATLGQGSSHNIFASAFADKFSFQSDEVKANALQRMESQLETKQNAERLIVSAEHFQSRVTDSVSIMEVFAFLSRYCAVPKVVVYIRPQVMLLESRLTTALKGGASPTIPVDMDEMLQADLSYYDYNTLISKWASVFGVKNIIVRLFERSELINSDLIDDFCFASGITPNDLLRPEAKNESLSVDAQLFLQSINNFVPRLSQREHPDHWMRLKLRQCISDFVGQGYRLSHFDAARFAAEFEEGNEALRRRYFPHRRSLFNYEPEEDRPSSISQQTSYQGLLEVATALVLKSLERR